MTYKCLECGHIFEEGEQARWIESRGEHFGVPCWEEMLGCPLCKGEYEKTVSCEICGSEHLGDELIEGVCEECIDLYKHNIDMCYKIGEKETESVEINCFLASMLEKEEIEKILFDAVKKKHSALKEFVEYDCERFVKSDIMWFAERLAEEVKK